jgi:two-component system CheB/CheR fusion protein
VTSFFRDADIFATLKRLVIPRLFAGKGAKDLIRVWVPGCATGEEAYSIAMLLFEHADAMGDAAPQFQIFATDIAEAAITTARAGSYPSMLLDGMSPARLSRFFVEGHDGSYTVSKDLRGICTFSVHSLIRDPPFSRIDLLSCRNLLIYLDNDLQAIVIPAFHYSLVSGGILLLGSSETVARHERLFATLDRSHRIFQKREGPSPPLRLTGKPIGSTPLPNSGRSPTNMDRPPMPSTSTNWANTRVLERYAPAFVVVTAEGNSLQYSSRIGRFLELAPGAPNPSVLTMARRGLRVPLRAALQQAVETNRPSEQRDVMLAVPGEGRKKITLLVEPRREQGSETLYLVVFLEDGLQVPAVAGAAEPPAADQAEQGGEQTVDGALRDAQEQLQSITEEHDTALEELRSANEELHSVNEELQSTNEELETSKEEIQSMNEELHTVNTQLAGKVDELDTKNSDLKNIFESTQVATLFLDPYLVVRSFTPAIANIYNLIPSDQGRPLTDIVSRLRYDGLKEDVHRVLSSLEPLERRVAAVDGATHYLMRILPYRTPESAVDGTILTFVDVTSIVQAEQHQRLLVDELNHRVKNMLTIVISMATQTLRRSSSLEAFSKDYLGRVHALSIAYSLLSDESWQTVQLRDLLMEELKPFLAEDRGNIQLEGPAVALEPRAALALGMAVHELTTNAVKYGALSAPGGKVHVGWNLDSTIKGNQLALEWLESGGPPVAAPATRGFGMTLMKALLAGPAGAPSETSDT